MFFTSGIIIAFFCFSFYLIWNQFLKKDTRLNIGLQILKKKINDLENLSLQVDSQIENHIDVVNEKSKRMLTILKTAEGICSRLEKDIHKKNGEQSTRTLQTQQREEVDFVKTSETTSQINKLINNSLKDKNFVSPAPKTHLKMVKEQSSDKENNTYKFGKSPFINLQL